MRFMIIVKASAESEADVIPSSEVIAAMGRFNEELISAGVLLTAEGLHSSRQGARIQQMNGKQIVKDGPFAETKELIAGFWIIDVKDKDEAFAWVRKIPLEDGEEIELRKVFEASDFPADSVSEGYLRKEQERREANQKPITA